MRIKKLSRCRLCSPKYVELGPFTTLVLKMTTKKCAKAYNARAQLLFCSLNLLFGDALVSVVVVMVCLSLLLLLGALQSIMVLACFRFRPMTGRKKSCTASTSRCPMQSFLRLCMGQREVPAVHDFSVLS